MDLHEHQAKELLASGGASVLGGRAVYSAAEAIEAARELGGDVWAVKAQIHAGGRGKAGGVKVVRTIEEVGEATQGLLGKVLITPQTGAAGKEVHRVYVERGAKIVREFYVSLLVDRGNGRVTFIASQEGGMEIEEVARKSPEKVLRSAVDPATGYRGYHGMRVGRALGLRGDLLKEAARLCGRLWETFMSNDLALLEVNPLAIVEEGGKEKLMCLDAKASVDDNALYRQEALLGMRDETEEDAAERRAKDSDLSYIKLDGDVGCMVNGAGLAMATLDLVKEHGGSPANFLDVGGGATKERVSEAFRIILSDDGVRAILVNIFGGIMRCDVIAQGVVSAAGEMGREVPLVVRLAGANAREGREILSNSGLSIEAAEDLDDAARKVTAATRAS